VCLPRGVALGLLSLARCAVFLVCEEVMRRRKPAGLTELVSESTAILFLLVVGYCAVFRRGRLQEVLCSPRNATLLSTTQRLPNTIEWMQDQNLPAEKLIPSNACGRQKIQQR